MDSKPAPIICGDTGASADWSLQQCDEALGRIALKVPFMGDRLSQLLVGPDTPDGANQTALAAIATELLQPHRGLIHREWAHETLDRVGADPMATLLLVAVGMCISPDVLSRWAERTQEGGMPMCIHPEVLMRWVDTELYPALCGITVSASIAPTRITRDSRGTISIVRMSGDWIRAGQMKMVGDELVKCFSSYVDAAAAANVIFNNITKQSIVDLLDEMSEEEATATIRQRMIARKQQTLARAGADFLPAPVTDEFAVMAARMGRV